MNTQIIEPVDFKPTESPKRGRPKKSEQIKEIVQNIEVLPETKPFLDIENPYLMDDPLKVINPNPLYEFRWCLADKMAGNRIGHWTVVDKTHSDFKNIRVLVDHAPDKTYFKYKDVILCCMRKETNDKIRKFKEDKIKKITKSFTKTYEKDVNKLTNDYEGREDAVQAMKSIEKNN